MGVRLLFGEETYLLETKLKKIKKDFGEIIKGINFIQVDESNIQNIISDIETPSFGYEKKMIIAKFSGLFKKEKKTAKEKKKSENSLIEKISNYIKENIDFINDYVELIFVEQEVEKNSLYKTIEEYGEVTEFELLKLPQLITNIKKICSSYKVNIDDNVAKYFIEVCGTNMQELINEIRKLIEYAGENGNIKKEDVDKLCIKQTQAIIFDLTDNLGKKDIQAALEVLNGLVQEKEPIQKILVTLYNHFKKLYIVKIAEEYNKNLAESMSLKPNQLFLTTKYKTQAKYFSKEELRKILEELINLDSNYKIGLIDLDIGLESILCRYCSK